MCSRTDQIGHSEDQPEQIHTWADRRTEKQRYRDKERQDRQTDTQGQRDAERKNTYHGTKSEFLGIVRNL